MAHVAAKDTTIAALQAQVATVKEAATANKDTLTGVAQTAKANAATITGLSASTAENGNLVVGSALGSKDVTAGWVRSHPRLECLSRLAVCTLHSTWTRAVRRSRRVTLLRAHGRAAALLLAMPRKGVADSVAVNKVHARTCCFYLVPAWS